MTMRGEHSRRWDSNPRPQLYESRALPLSYAGGLTEVGRHVPSGPHRRQGKPQEPARPSAVMGVGRYQGMGQLSPARSFCTSASTSEGSMTRSSLTSARQNAEVPQAGGLRIASMSP